MNPTSSEVEQHYRSFRAKRIQHQRGFYSLNRCSFSTELPGHPLTAWVKIFDCDKDSEFHREESMLFHLNLLSPGLAVPQRLHRVIDEKPRRYFLFMTCFDTVLAQAVQERAAERRFWTENEILYQVTRLADTVSELHQARIIHRNITPDSVFLKDGEVYLGHFDDSKQIARGIEHVLQTLRGCEVYLSPRMYGAARSQNQSQYRDAMKDDVWGVGLVMLAMAALKKPDHLVSYFSLPQTEFNRHVVMMLDGRCQNLVQVLTDLLTLDDTRRPNMQRVCAALRKVQRQCSQCNQLTTAWKWPCGHTICETCFGEYIRTMVEQGQTALLCTVCTQALPESYHSQRKNELLACPYPIKCRNIACSIKHWSFSFHNNYPVAHLIVCECGSRHCSYCLALKGHIEGRCPALLSALCPLY